MRVKDTPELWLGCCNRACSVRCVQAGVLSSLSRDKLNVVIDLIFCCLQNVCHNRRL